MDDLFYFNRRLPSEMAKQLKEASNEESRREVISRIKYLIESNSSTKNVHELALRKEKGDPEAVTSLKKHIAMEEELISKLKALL